GYSPHLRRYAFPQDKEKKKKESILDLSKYIDKTIRVKFQGGREASGILKGFDPLLNLVLDGTIEYMRGEPAWGCSVSRATPLPTEGQTHGTLWLDTAGCVGSPRPGQGRHICCIP
uniref:Sm domain-containing protein n=1 Tax=Castor canadensis TaxID=51338 RepID=A0A8C0XUC9_CASCN